MKKAFDEIRLIRLLFMDKLHVQTIGELEPQAYIAKVFIIPLRGELIHNVREWYGVYSHILHNPPTIRRKETSRIGSLHGIGCEGIYTSH